ncbi:ROK family protein [Leucobacter sp. HY1908]
MTAVQGGAVHGAGQLADHNRVHESVRGTVVLGLDVGGSSVKVLATPVGAVIVGKPDAVLQFRAPTPHAAPVAGLLEIVAQVQRDFTVAAIAVSIPGTVDAERGAVEQCVNIPELSGVDLGPQLAAATGVPVRVVNDGAAAALAEAEWGAGSGQTSVFVLALGTGIAGAHVVSGEVAGGAHGFAGELGHVVVDPTGALCSCGNTGCLETVLGAPAVTAAWERAGGTGGTRGLFAAHTSGDAAAAGVVDRAADTLGEALLTLCALVDPGRIVIGGGLAQPPHTLVTEAARAARQRATFHRVPEIVPAQLGDWAGAYGCALVAARAL